MCKYTCHCVQGVYEYWSRVEVDKRLAGCESGQCGIILETGCERLVSYDVIVAEKDAQGWVKVFACPSRTTAKHLGIWGRSFNMPYRQLTDLCYRRMEYNVYSHKERSATYNPQEPLQVVGIRIENP